MAPKHDHGILYTHDHHLLQGWRLREWQNNQSDDFENQIIAKLCYFENENEIIVKKTKIVNKILLFFKNIFLK